jgi:hypothetical protein
MEIGWNTPRPQLPPAAPVGSTKVMASVLHSLGKAVR